ncbi:MAG: hypothetical protein KH135_03200 [Firmicutes bacterium]|nr:hypothetical protein [Bacillota bacterium]
MKQIEPIMKTNYTIENSLQIPYIKEIKQLCDEDVYTLKPYQGRIKEIIRAIEANDREILSELKKEIEQSRVECMEKALKLININDPESMRELLVIAEGLRLYYQDKYTIRNKRRSEIELQMSEEDNYKFYNEVKGLLKNSDIQKAAENVDYRLACEIVKRYLITTCSNTDKGSRTKERYETMKNYADYATAVEAINDTFDNLTCYRGVLYHESKRKSFAK